MDLFRNIGEEEILVEIERIISLGAVPSGRAAREYYSSGDLPNFLEIYFRQRGIVKRNRQAACLGVSAQTLNKIFAGADISENMLFRFRVAIHRASLRKHYDEIEVEKILATPWRANEGHNTSAAIAELVAIIESLMTKLSQSNSIGSGSENFTDVHRAQLIALLREVLAKLEAPVVNVQEAETSLARAGTAIKKGFSDAIETESKNVAQRFFSVGRRIISELIKQKGFSSFEDFF